MESLEKNTKPVLVTGANGYVASWIVKRLLEAGHTVHATVRNPNNKEKVSHLEAIAEASEGTLKLFAADLLKEGAFTEAMTGCELVYHTASPFIVSVKDPQKDLIEPAEQGTANVLKSALATPSVKRVVVTSSVVAMCTDAIDTQKTPRGILDESCWNTTASPEYQPYSYSKMLAEKKAWEIAKSQNQWDLVTVNPGLVLGPFLNATQTTSESINILKQMGDGTLKNGAPRYGFTAVDVRDLAEAHYQAGFNPKANGRYIASAHDTNLFEMAKCLHEDYADKYPLPKKAAPKWLLMLIGPLVDKTLSRRTIKNNFDIEFKSDNSKIKSELGIQFRPLKETMVDSFQDLIDHGLV